MTWTDGLKRLRACPEAVEWAETQPNLETAWQNCERGDWMLWLAGYDAGIEQGNERHIRLCWAVCLIWWELAYPYWYDYGEANNDHRPERAIEALEAFCRGDTEAAWAVEATWARKAARAAWATWATEAAEAARAAEAVRAAKVARATEATRAAWAAKAAEAAKAALLFRMAEIVRDTCEVPILAGDESEIVDEGEEMTND